ncbi:MAG: hypothetical protein KIT84_26555 [Labilithrix sp.]|nr:hypothetical protein [Labilithrix sp.]MCW5814615.1 hypothetical protein [Labilithrix sp.]
MKKKAIVIVALPLAFLACASSTTSSTSPPPAVPPQPDPCAGDAPWLVAILGELPLKSDSIHLDRGMRDPQLASRISRGELRDVDGASYWLKNVSWTSQVIYEYPGRPTQKVVVARNVNGKDPLTLGDVGAPPALTPPIRLASGVLEYRPNPAVPPEEQRYLYVFPDATWMIVDGWMGPRFGPILNGTAESPPPSPSPPDTYLEYCFPRSGRAEVDGAKSAGIDMQSDHWAMRFRTTGSGLYAEIAHTFATPEIALHEEAAQRARCAGKKCQSIQGRVEGRVVRYAMPFGAL